MSEPVTSTRPPSWEVVSTVAEADQLILAFVAHHLHLGAERVRLFLDRPAPGVVAATSALPGCVVQLCDADWWRQTSQGNRPAQSGPRQRHNLQYCYDRSDCDWVVHLDADEFLLSDGPVAELLASVPPDNDYALAPVTERVYLDRPDPANIFDGAFRRPSPSAMKGRVNRIDGAAATYLQRGMTGYPTGKSAFRTGRKLTVGIHAPKPVRDYLGETLRGLELLHFDGLTAWHWVAKKLRKLTDSGNVINFETDARRNQYLAVIERQADREALRRLYLDIKQLDGQRAQGLDAMGLLIGMPFDPRPALARFFPGLALDFTEAGFDAYDLL